MQPKLIFKIKNEALLLFLSDWAKNFAEPKSFGSSSLLRALTLRNCEHTNPERFELQTEMKNIGKKRKTEYTS